jgi:hypothetical protein
VFFHSTGSVMQSVLLPFTGGGYFYMGHTWMGVAALTVLLIAPCVLHWVSAITLILEAVRRGSVQEAATARAEREELERVLRASAKDAKSVAESDVEAGIRHRASEKTKGDERERAPLVERPPDRPPETSTEGSDIVERMSARCGPYCTVASIVAWGLVALAIVIHGILFPLLDSGGKETFGAPLRGDGCLVICDVTGPFVREYELQ